jgi:RNA 2',3'-cyclic 3'-phosphodiesterase
MRLFVGIGLPDSISEPLAKAARGLLRAAAPAKPIRWTQPKNMHVTLSFLGQVDPAALERIKQSLTALRAHTMQLVLDGVDVLPHAGIVLARLKPSAPLLALAAQVAEAMEKCDIPRDQRPYTPHITLARTKARISLDSSRERNPAFWQRFSAEEFRLYESFTLPEGPRYEVLKSFPLSDAPGT